MSTKRVVPCRGGSADLHLVDRQRRVDAEARARSARARRRCASPRGRRSSRRCPCRARAAGSARSRRPRRRGASATSRSRRLATTPPPSSSRGTPVCAHASSAFVTSTSTTASRKPAATSARGSCSPRAVRVLHRPGDGGLQAAEGEVEAMGGEVLRLGEAAREADRVRVAADCRRVDPRPTRVGQPEQPGGLVEGLPRGVVERLAEQLDVADGVADEQERGVAAGDEQGDDGQLHRARIRSRARAGGPQRRDRRGGSSRRAACPRRRRAPSRRRRRP